ncbi:hypothetical protein HPULCUR_008829 [Helicostylum pulchrum]|uniref:Uncharacterized protein n=1 Tax=Helicostylum pulchrum TaxID=562976 RepID=A0ABP9Y9C0_9FUNG
MVFTHEFYDSDPLPRSSWRPSSSSYDSCATDEGYHTDEKPPFNDHHQQQQSSSFENEIPILKSNRTIQISYSALTYTLTLSIILLSIHTIIHQPFPWAHTFPPIFTLFHLFFHTAHLSAHLFNWLLIERHCVVYGTWLYWTGWLLSALLFSQRLVVSVGFTHPTTILFWLLMLERRNAWGIIVWEYVSRLTMTTTAASQKKPLKLWELGSFRLLVFRIWCLLGTGSFWGLLYILLAKLDGFAFKYLLQVHHIMKLLLVSTVGGLMMIVFWSFWTFQYKGVLWQKELRKGVIVWYSEGVAHAAEVY